DAVPSGKKSARRPGASSQFRHDAIDCTATEETTRMFILPAIDLRGGQCVRLRQGDYAQETVFGADPTAMAKRWALDGATFLHLGDLAVAKEGKPVNGESVKSIVAAAN